MTPISSTAIPPRRQSLVTRAVRIRAGTVELHGDLSMPPHAASVVLFAHGSGSSRFSTRNRFVAQHLNHAGFATLLFDLLTEEEEHRDSITPEHRFDIPRLARRLVHATRWVRDDSAARDLALGYFGASTGAAAALVAAAECPNDVLAVVSRGGRPDLAGNALARVVSPTLLIVGENDPLVIDLNNGALGALAGIASLAIVPGATHLFEEPGTLERVAGLATGWFQRYLGQVP